MQKVKIDIKGIERDVSPVWAPVGSCQDVVNLRPKDGATRPVLPKKVSLWGAPPESIFSTNDIRYIHKIHAHNALSPNEYLAEMYYEEGGNLYGRLSYFRISYSNVSEFMQNLVTWEVAEVGGFEYDLNFGFSVTGDVVDELLSVSFIGDMAVVSLTQKTTIHLYKDGRYRVNASITDLPDIKLAAVNHDQVTEDWFRGDEWDVAYSEYLQWLHTQREEHKRYAGHLMLVAGYTLVDGTLIRQSMPHHHLCGRIDGGYCGRKAFRYPTSGIYDIKSVFVSKVKAYIKETLPEGWAHLIKGIEIYAAFMPHTEDPKKEDIPDGEENALVFERTSLDDLFQNATFHNIHSIAVDTQTPNDSYDIEEEFDIDLTNLVNKQALEVDQNTHHDFCFKESLTYNSRIHAANTSTYLFKGHQLYIPHLTWIEKNAELYLVTLMGTGQIQVVSSDFAEHTTYTGQPIFRIHIKTDDGDRVVDSLMPITDAMVNAEGVYKILLPKVITYPHINAARFEILLPLSDDTAATFYEGTLKKHPFYNFSYHIVDAQVMGDSDEGQPPPDVTSVRVYFKVTEFAEAGFQTSCTVKTAFYPIGQTGLSTPASDINLTFWTDEGAIPSLMQALKSARAAFNTIAHADCWEVHATNHGIGTEETDWDFWILFKGNVGLWYDSIVEGHVNVQLTHGGNPELVAPAGRGLVLGLSDPVLPVIDSKKRLRKPIVHPNRLQLSALNNPLLWPAINSYRLGQDKFSVIKHLAVQSAPTSEGQFGQYPLIVFTDAGIYLLNQGQGGVIYGTSSGISDQVISGRSLSIDGAIIFTTQHGLFLLEGRNIKELNRYIIGNKTYLTQDTQTLENPLIASIDGLLYLKEAVFAFDYQHSEIVIANPLYDYHYRYNPNFGVMYIATQAFDGFMIKQGSYQGYTIEEADRSKLTIYEMNKDDSAVADVRVYFKTNPQNIGGAEFKKIARMLYYCDVITPDETGFMNMFVFGSNIVEETEFPLLQQCLVDDDQHAVYLHVGRTSFSVRYFIFMASGKVAADSVFHHIDAEVMPVLPGRLR
jgi:hypothetical protein